MGDCSGHVLRDAGRGGLRGVSLPVEVVVARADARGSAEIVDRHGVDARLAEPHRQLAVEVVETAYVGEDHHAGTAGVARGGGAVGAEPVPVGGLQDQVVALHAPGPAGDRRKGRAAFES